MKTIPDFATDIALALAAHGPVTVDLIETIDVHTEVSLECRTGPHLISCQIFKSSVTPDLDSVDIIRWYVDRPNFDVSFHGSFEDAVKFLDNLE